MRRAVFIGLLIAIAVGVGVWVSVPPASPPLEAPIRLAGIGEVFYLDGAEIVERGPARILVLRLDGPVQLVPHHFRADGLSAPQTIDEWAAHLGAPVVFNAGQFDERLEHLGWLKQDDTWLSSTRKLQWMGLLLSGPKQGRVVNRIVDLADATPEVADRYRHVVQSMMLVDHEGRIRVRESDLTACRTVVAEDKRGRISIIITEGAVTLANLARWLPKQDLGVVRAMNLDGGIETQIAINTPALDATIYGQHGTGATVFEAGPGEIQYPLPAVIAVVPR